MRLAEAYKKLKLEPSVTHELGMASRLALGPGSSMRSVRRLGTSTRMLIEMYLDLDASRTRGARSPIRGDSGCGRLLVICFHSSQGQQLLEDLRTIHRTLDLEVDLKRVLFATVKDDSDRLRGVEFRSWGVFCDHLVKEQMGIERPLGPYGLIRRVVQGDGGSWKAFDRDHQLVCHLTPKGVESLTNGSTCPVTYVYRDGTSAVTFPAWNLPHLNIRLVEAFK
jgi:hypothetical protein